VNILSLGVGASISWTSPYLPILQSDDSPLGSAISSTQSSWIGSLLAIGALLGSFLYGYLSEKVGRLKSLLLAAVPQIVSTPGVMNHPPNLFLIEHFYSIVVLVAGNYKRP
jgi:MFS family permease